MEAFLTGFLYVLGGGVGLAVLGATLSTTVQGVGRFRSRKKKEVSLNAKEEKALLMEQANQRAYDMYENNETIRKVVNDLEWADGKRDRAKLQKRLRDLVDDEVVRRVFYSRTR